MKKINTYSAQFQIIQPQTSNHENITNPNSMPNKKKLTEDRQEFVHNVSASGFKQFHAYCEAEKKDFFLEMVLSTFVPNDEKDYLLLYIAKSNQEFVENTLFKPQKTLNLKRLNKRNFSHLMSLSN